MKKTTFVLAAAVFAVSGCAGGKLKEQQAQIAQCRTQSDELSGRAQAAEGRIAGLEGEKTELQGKLSDLEAKLKASATRIDALGKSNKDLSSTIEAKKGELTGKVKELIGEKDELSRRIDELQKEKVGAERVRLTAQSKSAKLAADFAALRQRYEALSKELVDGKAAEAAAKSAEANAKEAQQAQRRERTVKAREELGALADTILKEIQAEQAKASQDGESISLILQEPLLFKPQQAKLTEEGIALLDRLGRALAALPGRAIRVECHSDNSPIKWELFGSYTSHWDLSAARASAISRYLHEHSGLDPKKITASGFGEFRPMKGNDTEEGKAANRRIVLVVEAPGS